MDINIDVTQPEAGLPIELDISTGVSYPTLDKKPQINGVILVGNKTAQDLGLQPQGDYALKSELPSGGDFVGKDELARVAFSGNYNDLSNKPTIPSVSNLATKTELEAKQDKLVAGDNITISGNVISSTGGVSDAYTKAETNNLLNTKQDKGNYALKSDIPKVDLTGYALKSEIPTKTSNLTNDSGFLTQHQDISGKQDKLIAGDNITIEGNIISSTGGSVDLSNYATKQFAKDASFPSTRFDELTLGASLSEYIAPANGYFVVQKVAGMDKAWFNFEVLLEDKTVMFLSSYMSPAKAEWVSVSVPVLKGQLVRVTYDMPGTTKYFRFIYAQGENEDV
jgi:hypothetical protein